MHLFVDLFLYRGATYLAKEMRKLANMTTAIQRDVPQTDMSVLILIPAPAKHISIDLEKYHVLQPLKEV